MDAHTEDDPEFRAWPPHCVAGTTGQMKPAATLLDKRVVVPNRPVELNLDGAEQIIVEKQTLDVFDTANIRQLLARLGADHYVVYGVVTEICVRCAAMGLLATGKPVTLVTDAVETLSKQASEAFLREFAARGGSLATAAEIAA